MKVKIRTAPGVSLPKRATEGAAGYDICAHSTYIVIEPGERASIPTGIFLEIPPGYEGQVRSRSGLALKRGIIVANAPGTVDSDFRGELRVILLNTTRGHFAVRKGERIAQLVFAKVEHPTFEQVEELSTTERGNNGFGSTGI